MNINSSNKLNYNKAIFPMHTWSLLDIMFNVLFVNSIEYTCTICIRTLKKKVFESNIFYDRFQAWIVFYMYQIKDMSSFLNAINSTTVWITCAQNRYCISQHSNVTAGVSDICLRFRMHLWYEQRANFRYRNQAYYSAMKNELTFYLWQHGRKIHPEL